MADEPKTVETQLAEAIADFKAQVEQIVAAKIEILPVKAGDVVCLSFPSILKPVDLPHAFLYVLGKMFDVHKVDLIALYGDQHMTVVRPGAPLQERRN